ncbi:MAG: hypothetical protein RMJ66_03710 [Bacteroidia bacterium]|nr:hypothetical protein [Bacteroidia bacterium]MDW8134153.1 hypothetical protein [Bacteroidia bacterium]
MRYAKVVSGAGILASLLAIGLVGCKKEKEQNGPSIVIPNEQGVIAGDVTFDPGSYQLRFKLIFQKGSGKDDGDLKDYSFSFNVGGGNTPVFTNRAAPNGSSFTFDTTLQINGTAGQVYTYTFSVRDKNDKTASRSFKVTFQQAQQPAGRFFSNTITLDTASNPFIYFEGSNVVARSVTNLSEVKNVVAALVVRRGAAADNRTSLVTPDSLGGGSYTFPYIQWTASNKPRTQFYSITQNEFNQATDSVSIYNVVNSANTLTKFSGNGDGARALLEGNPVSPTTGPHEYLAFKQEHPAGNPSSRIWGVIRRANVSGSAVTLEVKLIVR